MLKNTIIHYLFGLGLSLLTIVILEGILAVLPDIGWHFLTIIYITIFILQIAFYYFTTNFSLGWTVLSFLLNLIFWTFELVLIEKYFQESFIYKGDNLKTGALILGGLLWVTNKILIDRLFDFNKSIIKQNCKINV
jgi:hypothetical protein